tara:strand:- start:137 stop:334 length:198 start_codon:yes stop_codon:yes gene_type:complete
MVEQVVDLLVELEIVVAVVELDIMEAAAEAAAVVNSQVMVPAVAVVVDQDLFLPIGLALFLNKVD